MDNKLAPAAALYVIMTIVGTIDVKGQSMNGSMNELAVKQSTNPYCSQMDVRDNQVD